MNKRFLVRRGLVAASLLVVAGGGAAAFGATPSGASNKQVGVLGSFTTYVLVHNVFGPSIQNLAPGGTTSHQQNAATPTLCAGGIAWTAVSTNVTTHKPGVPNGSTAGKKYLKLEETQPANKKGCITFTRSSSPPTTATSSTGLRTPNVDYYAYALDAVGPVTGSNAGGQARAPIHLSLATEKNIYLCKPGYTTWATVTGTGVSGPATTHGQGGVTGAITRFWPQTGSGTQSVGKTILGFTPVALVGPTTPTSHGGLCGKSNKAIQTFSNITGTASKSAVNEENTEDGIIYWNSIHSTTMKNAIYIYSAGRWAQEWANTAIYNATNTNSINGKPIGRFTAANLLLDKMVNRKTASTTKVFDTYGAPSGTFTPTHNRGSYTINQAVVNEQNEWFSHIPSGTGGGTSSESAVPGVRYVYNVADFTLPGYSTAKALMGFDNSTTHTTATNKTVPGVKSALCHGDDSAAIIASGFVPLNSGSTMPAPHGGGAVTGSFGSFKYGSKATHNNTVDLAGATCREFAGAHLPTWGTVKAWTPAHYVPIT